MEEYRLYDGLHPPLVSEEDFLLAQRMRRERRPAAKVKKAFELKNAFAGLIFCARCGKRVGRTTLSRAQQGRARLKCVNSRVCRNASADYEAVEGEIISALRGWLEGYRVRIDAMGYEEELSDCRARLERLAREEGRLRAQLDNAHDLVEQGVYTSEAELSRPRMRRRVMVLYSLRLINSPNSKYSSSNSSLGS